MNLLGSFVLGLVSGLTLHHGLSEEARRIIGVGLCGGLTTWSSASFETVRLLEQGAFSTALRYNVLSLGGCLLCAAAGLGLALL